ncbi:MAG: hypothetical protein P4M04_13460 [Acidobacteriota bacterium]|nr:hypothetical protein [Acidobacteriota bacterium]
MAKTVQVIMAEDSLRDIFIHIARCVGEGQALAALLEDRKVTESRLASYCTSPGGTLKRGERAYWRGLLRQRLGFLNGIEAALRIGVTDEPDEDEEEDEAESTGPVLCWSNPKLVEGLDIEF